MPLTELTESVYWNRAFTGAFSAGLDERGRVVIPIPPCTFQIPSHGLVVGVKNGNARHSWRLGGWLSIKASSINTGSTSFLNTSVEILRRSLLLNERSLIAIPEYGIGPYEAIICFPKWHSTVFVEAWWFDSERIDPLIELIKNQE